MKKECSTPESRLNPQIKDSPGDTIAGMTDNKSTENQQASPCVGSAKRYRTNPDYILREIAGEAILVPVGESAAKLNGMLSLNETFCFVWKAFQKPCTIDNVATAAMEQFDGSIDEVTKDIQKYVRESIQYGFMYEED